MAQDEKRSRERELPSWWGPATLVLGTACLAGSIALVAVEGDASARDIRTSSRGIILGIALIALGLLSLRRRKSPKASPSVPVAPQKTAVVHEERDSASARPSRPIINLEGMLQNSNNVLATLRDLMLHGRGRVDVGRLPELLARLDLLGWNEAPVVRANRLRRNGRWWLSTPDQELSDADLDRLVSIEAALNIAEDMAKAEGSQTPAPSVSDTLKVAAFDPLPDGKNNLTGFLLKGASSGGEWECRMRFANAVENLPAPFRVEFDFQANVKLHVMCVDVILPGPACFAFAQDDRGALPKLARTYATQLSIVLGRCALAACGGISRVIVNGCDRCSGQTVLSTQLTPEAIDRMGDVSEVTLDTLQTYTDVRMAQSSDGWLEPVDPFEVRDSVALNPKDRFRMVELDASPCSNALLSACGSRRISDLGIMEKAGRAGAWNDMVEALGDTTQKAVSHLVDLRNKTKDLTVAEACDRTSAALVSGAVDVVDKRSLALLFVDGGTLADVTRRARATVDADPPAEQLLPALEELEHVLAPVTEMGVYLDDSDTVYRYFNSVAERIAYNRTFRNDVRNVRLVPDEYYAAQSLAARILTTLGRSDEALAHANELVRIAPLTPDAALSKVRCLEEQSRIIEASDMLKQAISYASTARDMSICFYRLAYMEWKLGRPDLSVACYQRSIELHPEVAPNARSEMSDLIETSENLRPYPADEVMKVLDEGGLPTGSLDALREQTRDALVACADEEVFNVARPLASVMLELGRDDALLDVRRSLMRP